MKAILVIEIPKDCWDCHLVDEWGNCEAIKITSNKYGVSIKQYSNGERPSWCPLKPLPDCPEVPDTIANDVAYIIGWNDCIVEILKNEKKQNR